MKTNPARPLTRRLEGALGPRAIYRAQRSYVVAMFRVMGGLLQAASEADPVVAREVEGFPEGLRIGMSVLGDSAGLRLRKQGARLVRDRPGTPCDLEVVFKHITHAFGVLSFQESTAIAFANARMIQRGDTALAMRLTRCLDRVQAVTLPRAIAARALKRVPELPAREKLRVALATYAHLLGDTFRGVATT
jgi:hypothetical protein